MLLERLAGGDRRSIGRSNEIVAEVLREPRLFGDLFAGLLAADPLVKMRAADAIEKVTDRRPDLLQRRKGVLLRLAAGSEQPEVRWHVAQMLPRLRLSPAERAAAIGILKSYLTDAGSIVKACAMQALAEFAERDERLQPETVALLEELTRTGTPAMKSRGRRLLERLRKQNRKR
jgi:hypothetical protein